MKRTYAAIAAGLIAMAPAMASAQGLGIKGGVSWNNVSNSGLLPGALQQFTGWTVGLGLGTTGTPLSLGIEALWAHRGLESSSSPDERKFNYVDVPAFLRVALPAGPVAPYVFAGPQVSFEVTCRTGSGDCPAGSGSGRPKTTFAAMWGAGLRLGSQSRISFEGRYLYGLTDLKLSTVTSSSSYRQRSFMILGGLGF